GSLPLPKPLGQDSRRLGEGVRMAVLAQALFHHVADEVPDVERRLAARAEVEVEEVDPRAVYRSLVGVEVTVDGPRLSRGQACRQQGAGLGQALESAPPLRMRARDGAEPFAQDAQFILDRVSTRRGDAAVVQLADR